MIQPLTVRGVELGAGAPKIIAPIVGRTREEILAQAAGLLPLPVDLAEWRADCYDSLADEAALSDTLRCLRETLGNLPLLFTIRTKRESGGADLTPARYAALTVAAARSGCADLVDAELSAGAAAQEIIDAAHASGCFAVGSRHDFLATPPREDMVACLREAQALGADIPKLAVMPRSGADALELLNAAALFHDRYADRPFVAISMGPRGMLSRVACALTGSCMTFGAAERSSAPGQLPVEKLRVILDALQSGS